MVNESALRLYEEATKQKSPRLMKLALQCELAQKAAQHGPRRSHQHHWPWRLLSIMKEKIAKPSKQTLVKSK